MRKDEEYLGNSGPIYLRYRTVEDGSMVMVFDNIRFIFPKAMVTCPIHPDRLFRGRVE